MAILAERKRVIDTFVAKELKKSNRKMMNNSDIYRALQGEKVCKMKRISDDDPRMEEYRKILDEMEGDEPRVAEYLEMIEFINETD